MTWQPIETKAQILDNQRLNNQTAVLTLDAPTIAKSAQPGQFVNLACDQFLRRPLGIMHADKAAGAIKVGIRIQGAGTRWLAEQRKGDFLSVLGPLGHGFDFSGFKRIITVGGGTGVFPLYFVQQTCRELGVEGIAVCGYRSREDSILTEEYQELACHTLFTSDCGDMEIAGHAGVGLEKLLLELPSITETAILTCGPKIMMQTIASIAARQKIPCQVSLEERMACGIGVCLVCVCAIKAAENGQEFSHQRCCVEGPVFAAEVVKW